MANSFSGFRYAGELQSPSAPPILQTFKFKDTETLTKGDLLNLESGEVDLAAQGDTAIIGIANETKSGTDSTTDIEVIVLNDTSIFEKYDATARTIGGSLRLGTSTTSGALDLASSTSGTEMFQIVASSTTAENTLLKLDPRATAWEND